MLNLPKTSAATPVAVGTSAHETSKIFKFDGTIDVQVVIINGEPHFVVIDVCNVLGQQNTSDILKKTLDSSEYLPYIVYRSGQQRTVNVVTESGLYALIFQSRKPVAREFRKWVTSEVLPSIRKTGAYVKDSKTLYPAKMQPTFCLVLDCYDKNGKKKNLYLHYDDSTWFDIPRAGIDRNLVMASMLQRIGERDRDIVRYEARLYHLRDGKYTPASIQFYPVDKTGDNSVKACENAIKDYQEAREKLKVAAKKLSELKNNESF